MYGAAFNGTIRRPEGMRHNRSRRWRSALAGRPWRSASARLPWRSASALRSSHMRAMSLKRESAVEGSEEQRDEPWRGARAHEADAPDFSRQRTEAGANFDAELVEQMLANGRFIDPAGNTNGIERPQSFAFRRQQRQLARGERLGQ